MSIIPFTEKNQKKYCSILSRIKIRIRIRKRIRNTVYQQSKEIVCFFLTPRGPGTLVSFHSAVQLQMVVLKEMV